MLHYLILFFLSIFFEIFAQIPSSQDLRSTGTISEIHIHIPFASGGATETLMRVLVPDIEKQLKLRVILHTNNQKLDPTEFVHQFLSYPPNNKHFLIGNLGTHATAQIIKGLNLKYAPLEDFIPVAMLGQTPMYLLIRNNMCLRYDGKRCASKVDNIKKLQQYMWKYKKSVTMGHAGEGSTSFLAALHFNFIAKTNPTLIQYGGSTPALTDLSNGFLDIMIDQSTSCLPYLKGNTLQALGQTGSDNPRYSITPEVKNFTHEMGWHEFNITGWNIIFAPRSTSVEVIKRLNNTIRTSLQNPVIKGNLALRNTLIFPDEKNRSAVLKDFIQSQIQNWEDIISDYTNKNN